MSPEFHDEMPTFWAVALDETPPVAPSPPESAGQAPPAEPSPTETFLLRGYEPAGEGTHPRLFGRGDWAA